MFPYISQWLWGSTSVQDTQQPATAETRQDSEAEEFVVKCEEEEEEEDEWLLVEGEPDSMGKQGPLFPTVVPNLSSTILSSLPPSPPCTGKSQMIPSSSQESDGVSESAGSWVVAPPACLTLEDSPSEVGSLENLLIEHPSMSVYRRSLSTHTRDDEESDPPTQESPTPLRHSQVATRHAHARGRVRQLMEVAPSACKKAKAPHVHGVPRLSRKALKRHNRHHSSREAGRGQRQRRSLQPQRR